MLDLEADQTFMIGDTMTTDILGGIQLGYHSILVLTGGTREIDLQNYAFSPDTIVNSIKDLSIDYLNDIISSQDELREAG